MAEYAKKQLEMLEKSASEFARRQLVADREKHDAYPFGPYFDDVVQKAYDVDFFHTMLPERFGGMAQGIQGLCAILDPICQADAGLGGVLFTNAFAQQILLSAQETETLESISGSTSSVKDSLLAYPVFTHPMEIEPTLEASEMGGSYALNGSTEYIVLGGIAEHAVVPAKISGQQKVSLFFVQMSDSGIEKSDPILSLGFHACPAVDVTFNSVKGELIGTAGTGGENFTAASNVMGVAAAAISLGIMKGSYKEAVDFSRRREQGGRKIIDWSEVKRILTNMAVKVKTAEMSVTQAAYAVDQRLKGWQQCSQAVGIHVCEIACDVTTDGVQVLGGVGYMEDYAQAKRYRDAKQAQSLMGIATLKKLRYLEN